MAENVVMTIENTPRNVNCATMINETVSHTLKLLIEFFFKKVSFNI